ncbi:hypothetical protein FTUN_7314 [Frigoriglobus tundricola]|uniref:Uncharacterized protein n=1 Tax=Frigoriglobus tundricola TaxID=2774151 RepID=A0A6M5Z2E3_9BACT|nr:hypothetical protein FTUN_7314 [Frigoriglobus tundricola]
MTELLIAHLVRLMGLISDNSNNYLSIDLKMESQLYGRYS